MKWSNVASILFIASACADAAIPWPERDPTGERSSSPYKTLAADAVAQIAAGQIHAHVEQLSSMDAKVRHAVIQHLLNQTGIASADLHTQYDPNEVPERNERAIFAWRHYAKSVQQAMDDAVPYILNTTEPETLARRRAIIALGEDAPHKAWLPLLREVASNKSEPRSFRYFALTSISQIPHDEVLLELVRWLDDESLGLRAYEQLRKLLAGYPNPPAGSGYGPNTKIEFERWIAKHKDEFVYRRWTVLEEH